MRKISKQKVLEMATNKILQSSDSGGELVHPENEIQLGRVAFKKSIDAESLRRYMEEGTQLNDFCGFL